MSLLDKARELADTVKRRLTGDQARETADRAIQGAHRAKHRLADAVQDARSRLRRT